MQVGPCLLHKSEVLDLLQKVFYTSDAARESFVELCEEEYVQKARWDGITETDILEEKLCFQTFLGCM